MPFSDKLSDKAEFLERIKKILPSGAFFRHIPHAIALFLDALDDGAASAFMVYLTAEYYLDAEPSPFAWIGIFLGFTSSAAIDLLPRNKRADAARFTKNLLAEFIQTFTFVFDYNWPVLPVWSQFVLGVLTASNASRRSYQEHLLENKSSDEMTSPLMINDSAPQPISPKSPSRYWLPLDILTAGASGVGVSYEFISMLIQLGVIETENTPAYYIPLVSTGLFFMATELPIAQKGSHAWVLEALKNNIRILFGVGSFLWRMLMDAQTSINGEDIDSVSEITMYGVIALVLSLTHSIIESIEIYQKQHASQRRLETP